jgi:hypothetical protein
MVAGAITRFDEQIAALEESAERAGRALGCPFSSAADFEAEAVRDFRSRQALARRRATRLRIMLVVAALAVALLIAV